MPTPDFQKVQSEQALSSYGPEFIDTADLPADLEARISEIQEYLRKVKAIDAGFPEEELDLDTPVEDVTDYQIEAYNQWLQKVECIQLKEVFKIEKESFFTNAQPQNEMTYRKAYIKYLESNFEELKIKHKELKIKHSDDVKKTVLKTFLNKAAPVEINGSLLTGFELYQLALKEEMCSTPFKRAVFFESLKIYKTNKEIKKKPVLCLLGPSGSGKSFSGDAFFKKFFPEDDKNQNQLMVFSADNGIPRAQSKMLALTKQILESTGHLVLDLDKESKEYYKNFKVHIRELGLKIISTNPNTTFGLFIPETFAKQSLNISLFSKQVEEKAHYYLKDIGMTSKDINRVDFYAGKITHEDEGVFPHLVKIMAEQRAHPELESIRVAQQMKHPFTLYPQNLKEYKKYSSSDLAYQVTGINTSFEAGMDMAKTVIDAWESAGFPMKWVTVTNDLILLHQEESKDWRVCNDEEVKEYAKKHLKEPDNNYQVVSRAVYNKWNSGDKSQDLKEYAKENKIPPKIDVEDAKKLHKDTSNTLALKKIKRVVQEPINQACIDKMTKAGMGALAEMCLKNEDFQTKFPKFFEVVKKASIASSTTSLDDDESYQRVLKHIQSRM